MTLRCETKFRNLCGSCEIDLSAVTTHVYFCVVLSSDLNGEVKVDVSVDGGIKTEQNYTDVSKHSSKQNCDVDVRTCYLYQP